MKYENQQIWMVVTPDETSEILASFKHEEWAKGWRDKYSATSSVVSFTIPTFEPEKTSVRFPHF